ncbi:MAG: hypothetical protein WBO10_15575 [Pyrinomonadaceae bacterium]
MKSEHISYLRLIVSILGVLILGLFFERLWAAEYIEFLEYDLQVEQLHRNLKKGMTESEVRQLASVPPDNVTEVMSDETDRVLSWSSRDHIGFLHKCFGSEPRDRRSYMKLFLDFDHDGQLSRIYYGG